MSNEQPYTGTDRRHEKAIPMHVLTHIGDVVEQFRRDENARHERLDNEISERFRNIHDRFDTLENKIHNLTDSVTVFMGKSEVLWSGFPGQDPEGHRRAHEEWLAESREKKEFYVTLKKELAKYGLFGLVGWLLFWAWHGFLQGPPK